MGEEMQATTFGEVALGSYGEIDEWRFGQDVVPTVPAWGNNASTDLALRIGIGYCAKYTGTPNPFTVCGEEVRMDGLRLYKNGTLWLKRNDGSKPLADVQGAIEALQDKHEALEAEHKKLKAQYAALQAKHEAELKAVHGAVASLM